MRSAIKTGVVDMFRGNYLFLSNYYTAPFEWRNTEFHSAEQAFAFAKGYHAMTSLAATFGVDRIMEAKTPGDAKKAGRALEIDVNAWDAQKITYMREIVHAKFEQVVGLAGQLLNTGAMMLVEGNTWGDTFWGRCGGKGYNHLGVILMEERGYWQPKGRARAKITPFKLSVCYTITEGIDGLIFDGIKARMRFRDDTHVQTLGLIRVQDDGKQNCSDYTITKKYRHWYHMGQSPEISGTGAVVRHILSDVGFRWRYGRSHVPYKYFQPLRDIVITDWHHIIKAW